MVFITYLDFSAMDESCISIERVNLIISKANVYPLICLMHMGRDYIEHDSLNNYFKKNISRGIVKLYRNQTFKSNVS